MILRFMVFLLAVASSGVSLAGLNLVAWMYCASLDPDPTAGGAYAAMAMLTSIPVGVVGAIATGIYLARLDNGDTE